MTKEQISEILNNILTTRPIESGSMTVFDHGQLLIKQDKQIKMLAALILNSGLLDNIDFEQTFPFEFD